MNICYLLYNDIMYHCYLQWFTRLKNKNSFKFVDKYYVFISYYVKTAFQKIIQELTYSTGMNLSATIS